MSGKQEVPSVAVYDHEVETPTVRARDIELLARLGKKSVLKVTLGKP